MATATRDVRFTFAAAAGDVVTDHMTLRIRDSAGALVFEVPLDVGWTSYVVAGLPVGTGYVATLTAYSATNVPDTSPPAVAFDVVSEPPPGDPTLNAPSFA